MASVKKNTHRDGTLSYQVRITMDYKTYNMTCDEETLGVSWKNWTEPHRRKEVTKWAAIKEQELKNGLVTGRKAVKRFKEYSDELLERDVELGKIKPQTAVSYGFALKSFYAKFGKRKIQDITPEELTKFFMKMAKDGCSNKAIQLTRACVSRVFTNAIKNGYIQSNPLQRADIAKGVPKVHDKRKLTVEEIQELLKASDDEWLRNKACFYILVFTGCRRGEACGMRWQDIDLQTGVWNLSNNLTTSTHLPVETTPKTGNRQIVMPVELVNVLKEWRQEQFRLFGIDTERYVLSDGTRPYMTPQNVQSIINRLVKKTGIDRFTPHELRHSFISNLVDSGENVKAIADYAGNSPKTVMDVYAHTNTADMQRISDGIYSQLKSVN